MRTKTKKELEKYYYNLNIKRDYGTDTCVVCINRKRNDSGYYSIKVFGFCKLHRFIYYYFNNENLSSRKWLKKYRNKVVRHSCDHPDCVNPFHLLIGTQADNVLDRHLKNRNAVREKNGNAKLCEKDIDFIKYYANKRPKTEIARFMGVNAGTIQRIISGKSWQPLPEPPKESGGK